MKHCHSIIPLLLTVLGTTGVVLAVADESTLENPPEAASGLVEPAPMDEGLPQSPDLGPPLVDHPERLQPLMPGHPVWFDKERRAVVLVGQVCQRYAPLELFACLRGSKEHESIVVVDTKAFIVHAGLLATGAQPGNPVQFYPEFVPATGPEIEITVLWKDEQGRRRELRAQDWIRDVSERYAMYRGVVPNRCDEELNLDDRHAAWKSMEHPFVFGGSGFVEDEATGKRFYRADSDGCLICVSNFSTAVLDVPIRSTDSASALVFEAFTQRIPPLGTPVTLILTPQHDSGQESPTP